MVSLRFPTSARTLSSRVAVVAVAPSQHRGRRQPGDERPEQDGCLGLLPVSTHERQLAHQQGDGESDAGHGGDQAAAPVAPAVVDEPPTPKQGE